MKHPYQYQTKMLKLKHMLTLAMQNLFFIDGTRAMTVNLNLNNNKIINLEDPTDNQDAFTKKYLNSRLNMSIDTTDQKNKLAYIINNSGQFSDDQNITGVKFIDKDFHKVNKKTYEMTLHLNKKPFSQQHQMALDLWKIFTSQFPTPTNKWRTFHFNTQIYIHKRRWIMASIRSRIISHRSIRQINTILRDRR